MYLGMVAILLGVALLVGSLITFLVPLCFGVLMEVLFVPVEERNLEGVFGEEYLDYKRRVRRWI